MPLTGPPARYKAGVITPRLLPAERETANADLLPPPGPYIRHLNFTNFRTIGSRRSQEEAVRGRFVTAGRLEGVIKVSPLIVVRHEISPNITFVECSQPCVFVYDRIRRFIVILPSH